jgi:hypothetical protein
MLSVNRILVLHEDAWNLKKFQIFTQITLPCVKVLLYIYIYIRCMSLHEYLQNNSFFSLASISHVNNFHSKSVSSVGFCFGQWTNQIGQLRKEKKCEGCENLPFATLPPPPPPQKKNKLIVLTLYRGISAPVYNGSISPGEKWWWTVLKIEISWSQGEGSACTQSALDFFSFKFWGWGRYIFPFS